MGDQGTVNYPSMGMELFNTPIDLLIVALVMAPLTVPHARSRFIKTVLTWRPLVFVAKVSYGVYLWHIAVIYWFLGGLIGQHNLIFAEVTVIGISIALATVSFYLVERPAQKLRIRLGKASREPSVAVLETTA
jgi:peptidoglycan/LPS O-acetylase OafA/YrhL